jgi:hypothetical protein
MISDLRDIRFGVSASLAQESVLAGAGMLTS